VTCPLLLLSEWLSEPSRPRGSRLECLLGGVRVLVGPPVFKTGVSSDPAQAGSIPVRLRYQGLSSPLASVVRLSRLRPGTDAGTVLCDRAVQEGKQVIRNRGGYWQVKVYAGLDPLTGKQRFEYDRARTKREAERVEAALKTNVAEGRIQR
jgi:hypothetical protein